jgi:hypothetical protein
LFPREPPCANAPFNCVHLDQHTSIFQIPVFRH